MLDDVTAPTEEFHEVRVEPDVGAPPLIVESARALNLNWMSAASMVAVSLIATPFKVAETVIVPAVVAVTVAL